MTARAGAAEAEIFAAHALLLDDAAIIEPALRQIDEGEPAGARLAGARRGRRPRRSARSTTPTCASARWTSRTSRRGCWRGSAGGAPGAGWRPRDRRRRRADAAARRPASIPPTPGRSPPRAAEPPRTPRSSPARSGIPAVVGLGGALLAIAEGTPLVRRRRRGHGRRRPDPRGVAGTSARAARPRRPRRAALARAAEPGALARRPPDRGLRERRQRRRRRALRASSRAPRASGCCAPSSCSSTAPTPPDEEEQVAVLTRDRRRARRPSAGRAHARRRRRQAAAVPAPGPGGQPVPRARAASGSRSRSPELFRTQLRAILRVAAEHPLKVMFPMVSTLDELRAARARCSTRCARSSAAAPSSRSA